MPNNEPGSVIRYIVSKAQRIPIDMINTYIDMHAPEDSERPPVRNWRKYFETNPPTDKLGNPIPYFALGEKGNGSSVPAL